MKNFFRTILVISTAFTISVQARFLEQDIYLPESELNSITKVSNDFKELVKRIHKHYDNEINHKGAILKVDYDLSSSAVNAYASREKNIWKITFKGGLLRHKKFDRDLFALILCHELGHHIGGSPLKFPGHVDRGWVSTEGQADYFATNSCLKKLFHHEDNAGIISNIKLPIQIVDGCANFQNINDQNLCKRSSLIAIKGGEFTRSLGRTRRGYKYPLPKIDNPDQTVVKKTSIMHPNPQCRLDTYFQGSLCTAIEFPLSDPYSNCADIYSAYSGARPRCWYHSSK